MMSNASGVRSDSDELRYLLYFSIIFGVIEVIVIYGKYDFLNVKRSSNLVDDGDLPAFDLSSEPLR